MKILILSLLLILDFLQSVKASEYLLPSQFHSLPVLIRLPFPDKTEFGTGVFLSLSNKFFLVTAAHVIFNIDSTNKNELNGSIAVLTNYKLGTNQTDLNGMEINLQKLLNIGCIKRHPSHDVAVILLGVASTNLAGNTSVPFSINADAVSISPNSSLNVFISDDICRNFSDVIDGEETYIFGYPAELLKNPIAQEVDFSYPLIRTGVISQRNLKTNKLILDTGVFGGNSGGPVLVVEHPNSITETYKLAGIVTQFVPVMTRIAPQIGVTNNDLVYSGYSVAEPIDYALELMRQF